MRILHTAHSYAPDVSGVAEVVGQLSSRLAHRGHEVHVACNKLKNSARKDNIDGVHVHRFDVSGNAILGMRGEIDAYVNFVKSIQWDIITMHCAQTWSTDALLPYADTFKAGKIFVSHGISALQDQRYRQYFSLLGNCLSKFDKVVALSSLLEEMEFCAKHGLPNPYIIPNGVDLKKWNDPPHNLRKSWNSDGNPWILSVSNHSTVKRHDVFFEVIRQIRKKYPNTIGTIIGGHYPAEKWNLGQIGVKGGCWYRCCLSAHIWTDIELRENVLRIDVISAIKEADVVLITSSREASPLVALESMAAGTPWISFDVGCIRENTGGFVVNDIAEMADKTSLLISNPELRAELGEKGKKRILERHSWDSIVREYEKLYYHVTSEINL